MAGHGVPSDGTGDLATPHAAAEEARRVQMGCKAERAVLERAWLAPVEGGELAVEVEEVREVGQRKRWWEWFGDVNRKNVSHTNHTNEKSEDIFLQIR